jgi:sigma-E factor negative regulatory protein RseA
MNTDNDEERDSQLAAMFDDELPAAQCELLAGRLARDPALRRQWGRYALLGAALRGEHGAHLHTRLASRVAIAISIEPAFGTAGSAVRAAPRWLRPVAGVAVAASVALGAIVLLRYQALPGAAPLSAAVAIKAAAAPALVAGRAREPESYVVPASSGDGAHAIPSAQLANYVVAHSEFSTPLGRRNLLSALVASDAQGSEPAAPSPTQQPAGGAPGDPSATQPVNDAHVTR